MSLIIVVVTFTIALRIFVDEIKPFQHKSLWWVIMQKILQQISRVDQQKFAWFESDFCLKSAS